MKRHFIKKPVTASKRIKASYSPMLLHELVSDYSTNDLYSLDSIWDEVFNQYGDEGLADDVVDAVEAEREELGIMCSNSSSGHSSCSRGIVTGSTQAASGFSFDFIWKDDYDAQEIESVIYRVFQDDFNLEVFGIDFHSVDYEDIKEYAGENISQCGVDFAWEDDYPDGDIVNAVAAELQPLGYTLIGYDFYSL